MVCRRILPVYAVVIWVCDVALIAFGVVHFT